MIPVAVSLSVFWIVLTYVALSAKETHPLFRLLLVLSAGGVSLALSPIDPEIRNLLWLAPSIGLVANLWSFLIRIDKRTAVSIVAGGVITFLFLWGVLPRQNAEAENDSPFPPTLPTISEIRGPQPPAISEEFLAKIQKR